MSQPYQGVNVDIFKLNHKTHLQPGAGEGDKLTKHSETDALLLISPAI